MKPPVQIREAYVAPGDEFRQFPGHTYLSRDEVSTAFPLGSISHERFSHLGLRWRIIKRSSNQVPGGHLFVAVMDDQANPPSPGRRWPSDTSVPESNGRSALRSVRSGPLALEGHLDGHLSSHHLDEATPASPHEHDSHDCSPLPNGHGSHNHHQSSLHKSYSTGPGSGHHQSTFSHTMNGIHASQSAKQIVPSGPNRTQSSYSTRPLLGAATSWPHRPQSVVSGPPAAVASSYRYQLSQDLVTCNEAATAMERYKAFWRLFGTLSRLRGEVWDARRAAWEAHKQHVAQNASAATGRRFRRSGSPTGNGPRSADSSSSGGVNSSTMNSPSDGHDGKASHSGGTSTRGSLELSTCDPRLPSSWVDNEDAHDLLRHTVMVGEALAKFGNTAFVASSGGSGGDNATRAITAKDYGELLRQYLKVRTWAGASGATAGCLLVAGLSDATVPACASCMHGMYDFAGSCQIGCVCMQSAVLLKWCTCGQQVVSAMLQRVWSSHQRISKQGWMLPVSQMPLTGLLSKVVVLLGLFHWASALPLKTRDGRQVCDDVVTYDPFGCPSL